MKSKLLIAIIIISVFTFLIYKKVEYEAANKDMLERKLSTEEKVLPLSVEEQILNAIKQKHGWEEADLKVIIAKNDGIYATGSIGSETPGPGGGIWFAKNVNGVWEIVWDGNGGIMCEDLANYSDFPDSLIPQCFDSNYNSVIR